MDFRAQEYYAWSRNRQVSNGLTLDNGIRPELHRAMLAAHAARVRLQNFRLRLIHKQRF